MDSEPDPTERLRLLLDVDRLAVAGALAARPMTTDALVEATGRSRRVVLAAIADLRLAALVGADGDRYQLDVATLRRVAKAIADAPPRMDPTIGFGMTPDERRVLDALFDGMTLLDIPRSRTRRLVVLQRLALEFEPGRKYPESAVNELLGRFHPDWSALRRHLVDEGLLDRAHIGGVSTYWRSGGRVDV